MIKLRTLSTHQCYAQLRSDLSFCYIKPTLVHFVSQRLKVHLQRLLVEIDEMDLKSKLNNLLLFYKNKGGSRARKTALVAQTYVLKNCHKIPWELLQLVILAFFASSFVLFLVVRKRAMPQKTQRYKNTNKKHKKKKTKKKDIGIDSLVL